jgi:hypothetical protein
LTLRFDDVPLRLLGKAIARINRSHLSKWPVVNVAV